MQKKNNPKLISIIVPIFNEEDIITLFKNELLKVLNIKKYKYEVLLINNNSSDNTKNIIAMFKSPFKVIELTNYFGKENAILCGLDISKGDYVIIMDPDLEDPPHLIPKLIDRITQGYDVVYAKRSKIKKSSNLIESLKKVYYYIFSKFAEPNMQIYENTGDFKILSRNAVNNLTNIREITRFNRSLTSYVETNASHIEFERPKRVKGKSKSNFKFLWNYALNSIISSSSKPLEIWFYFGLIWFFLSIFFAMFILYQKVSGQSLDGWASTLLFLLFFSSFNTLSIGVLSLYLNRIYQEVKKRPNYIIRKK